MQTQKKLKSNISYEEKEKLLICKGDITHHLKAPDLSYMMRAAAFTCERAICEHSSALHAERLKARLTVFHHQE
jgi:hypothetical protein